MCSIDSPFALRLRTRTATELHDARLRQQAREAPKFVDCCASDVSSADDPTD